MLKDDWRVKLYYSNPNIHPKEEYDLRRTTLEDYATTQGVPYEVGPYEPDLWNERVGLYGGPYPLIPGAENFEMNLAAKKRRCLACYRLRFEQLALCAHSEGLEYLDSTLTISPYQFAQEIKQALSESAQERRLSSLDNDWRPYYAEATSKSLSLGMYRQNYCGCFYSEEEARLERQARKAAKRKTQGVNT